MFIKVNFRLHLGVKKNEDLKIREVCKGRLEDGILRTGHEVYDLIRV
jgi:hypothetical protein